MRLYISRLSLNSILAVKHFFFAIYFIIVYKFIDVNIGITIFLLWDLKSLKIRKRGVW